MRVGGLVHARMSSERLPGKGLLPIVGRPALEHLLERMLACSYLEPARVVLATTIDERDNPLAELAANVGVQCYRGSREDVVDRLYQAARAHGFDAVVQVDGDDVCADPQYMDAAMRTLLADDTIDLVLCKGLPIGIASKAIHFRAFERIIERYLPGDNGTGGFLYFTATGLCRKAEIGPLSPDHVNERARLTLDEPEDLALFRAVFADLYREGSLFGVAEIVSLLRRRPELVEINASLTDGYTARTTSHVARERLRYHRDGVVVDVPIP